MKKCPYCGADNNEDANVCSRCFGELPVKEENNDTNEHEETRASRKKTRS